MSWFDQRPDDAMMGSFEAVGPDHIHTVDQAQFREAMSRLGAAVHVVTTAGRAGTAGFTATAVVSVSDQPATLLVCINRRSQVAPLLEENRVLCVNTLRPAPTTSPTCSRDARACRWRSASTPAHGRSFQPARRC